MLFIKRNFYLIHETERTYLHTETNRRNHRGETSSNLTTLDFQLANIEITINYM